MAQCLKLIGAGCLIFVLVFLSRDFKVGSKSELTVSPVPYGANLLVFSLVSVCDFYL